MKKIRRGGIADKPPLKLRLVVGTHYTLKGVITRKMPGDPTL